MDLTGLQIELAKTGRYAGNIDGLWGRQTKEAIIKALEDGPDTKLDSGAYGRCATRLAVSVPQVMAFKDVESAGAGYEDGKPKLLPERHWFSQLTDGRFDKSHPHLSYPKWGTLPYPVGQQARYAMLLEMIHLDVDAGFQSASYGLFQIMGFHYRTCGYPSPYSFAVAQAYDEETQLKAFESLVVANRWQSKLRACTSDPKTCEPICEVYNGKRFREHNYHGKIAARIAFYQARGL